MGHSALVFMSLSEQQLSSNHLKVFWREWHLYQCFHSRDLDFYFKCDMQSKADAIPYLCNFRHEKAKMAFQLLKTNKFRVQCGRAAQFGEKVIV